MNGWTAWETPAHCDDKLQEWLDQRIEIVLAHLLRTGVLTAACVVLAGAVLYLGGHARDHADYHTFRGEPEQLRSVHGVLHAAFAGQINGDSAAWACCY